MWMRALIVCVVLLWAAPAWAQRSITVPRAVVPVASARCSAPLLHVGADGRVTASASLLDAHRLDPSRRFYIRLEQAPAETGPWALLAAAETYGTPQRVEGIEPSVSTEAPPNGWWSRACIVTGDRSIETGVSVTATSGVRLARPLARHNSVAIDTSVSVSGNSVGSLTTGNMTVAGTDRVGVAAVMWRQTGIDVSSVTIATVAASAVTGAAATNATGNTEAAIWCAIAPSTGSQTASVTFSNTWGNDLALIVSTYTGADQTTPCQNGNAATGNDTAATVTVASAAADDIVVDAVIALATAISIAVDANQTSIAEFEPNGSTRSGSSYQDGADGGVMSWTLGATAQWSIAAARVVAAAAAGGGPCLGSLLGVGCDE